MDYTRAFLAITFVIGFSVSFASGDETATWEDFRKSSAVWAKKELNLSTDDRTPKLLHQLTAAPAANASSNSSSDGWLAQCDHLSGELEKSWDLIVVVAENNWPVVEGVAETLYGMLLNCTQGHVWTEGECFVKNLVVLKNILVPAVKMNVAYVQDAWHLIPDIVNSTKECFTFDWSSKLWVADGVLTTGPSKLHDDFMRYE